LSFWSAVSVLLSHLANADSLLKPLWSDITALCEIDHWCRNTCAAVVLETLQGGQNVWLAVRLTLYKLKIGIPVTIALANVQANLGFLCLPVFNLEAQVGKIEVQGAALDSHRVTRSIQCAELNGLLLIHAVLYRYCLVKILTAFIP